MAQPTGQTIRVECAQCGEVNNCDETVLDNSLNCGACEHPIEIDCYPHLMALRDEREILRKSRQDEAKRKKREQAEVARDERRRQKAEQEKEEEQQTQWKHGIADAERHRLIQAEARAKQDEDYQDNQRLQHGGGCQRCGSVRLKQKDESPLLGNMLGIIFFLGAIAFGWFGTTVLLQAETIMQEIAAILFLVCAVVSLIGFSMCYFLGSKRAYCEKCGWSWRA